MSSFTQTAVWYLATSITRQGGFTCMWPTGSHAFGNPPPRTSGLGLCHQLSCTSPGPNFLHQPDVTEDNTECFQLVNPDLDVEIRPQVTTLATKVAIQSLGTHRFQRFSSWNSLVRGVTTLTHVARSFSPECTQTHVVNGTAAQDLAPQNFHKQSVHSSKQLSRTLIWKSLKA